MLRNKEVRRLFTGFSVLSLIAIIAGFYMSLKIGMFALVICALFMTGAYLFSLWRYREIEHLSNYVRRISNGDLDLDVRDNREGELSILRNDIYKVTNKLSEQGVQLQQDKVHLSEAISDISHQLKTPLTSMNMMIDLLNNDSLPYEKREEFTITLRKQIGRMEWLVASLLKLSKIDAGTAIFKQESIDMKALIKSAIESISVPLDIKGQMLAIDGGEGVSFVGDFEWTREALINLLKNSMEHTPEKGVIDVHFSENVMYTEMVLRDQGQGISKEDLPYVFQRFYKGKTSGENSVGIGLALVHSIVKAQNGNIKVESDGTKGTTFTVTFYK